MLLWLRLKGMDHQKAWKISFFKVNSLPLYCLEHVRKFQEIRTNSFWTPRLSVEMAMAGMWYLWKHFLCNANISLSIHKNEKNHKNSTPSKIKFHIIQFFFLWWILKSLKNHLLKFFNSLKKSFIIHLREKRFKHIIIIMSCQQKFVSMLFSVKGKEYVLDRKYRLLRGPAENASSPTISWIQQNWWSYFIYKHLELGVTFQINVKHLFFKCFTFQFWNI